MMNGYRTIVADPPWEHGIDKVVTSACRRTVRPQIIPSAAPIVASPLLLLPEDELQRIATGRAVAAEGITNVEALRQKIAHETYDTCERALAVLQWLESANVEIVDQPIMRQVRRNAERKGANIAKVVRVKLPKSWRDGQPPQRAGSIEFSHRFEVRGHYKFYRESTRLAQAQPEKLSWVPERDGYFRRIWCPPFVKGPADKPLVPKVRKLVAV